AQPASGATITIDIPQDIEIYGISYDNLITESWNTKYEVIKEDSNYLLILLLDTTGKRIPADTTTLFFIQYYAVSPCNFDYFIHWDTALSDDPSRSTRFSDTLSTTFYPVFDYYKDTTKIIGYTPGDANNSGGEPDISDITFVIAYLYLGGPGPCIINALDANGSCGSAPDISDITKLISYLYLGGLEPECGCIGEETVAYKANLGKMAVNSGYENDYTIISLITDQNISGLHLELSGIGSDIPEKVLQDDIEMFYGIDGNTIKIGLFDIEGQKLITSGSQPVIKLEGEYEIIKAVASTKTYQSVALAINPKVEDNNLPTDFTLYQNFPNPFNPTTEICFDLPNACNVKLEIFNIMGQKVTTLIDQGLDAGHHTVQWDAGNNASGIYLYKITAGDFVETKKMVLLK
ncbi:MAG: T9SS type A sorting domain-containing protein, partial [candidate division Zixibacteria bacterium]|nr:T9SS type A sorting domain-containing protein [candidate division Zixibacteria bacterium]